MKSVKTLLSMRFLMVVLCCVCLSATVGAKKKFAVVTGDESLQSLTKITDSDEPIMNPFGGNDGKNLYFTCKDKKGFWNIFMRENPMSQAMTQRTNGNNRNFSPVYNPILDKIAFRCQMDGNNTSDIYMMGSTSKAMSPITESSNAFEDNPSFSPNGEWLAYDKCTYSKFKSYSWNIFFGISSNTTIVENSEIWIKNLKTGELILLCGGYQPRFSPDGKHIAYVKYAADAKSTSIWLMKADGSEPMQITDAKKGYAMYPCWSPDGKKLVFQSFKKDKKDNDLYVIDIDGNNLTQITKNKSSDCQPYWSNDGHIYFCSDRGGNEGNYQIWRFKAEKY